MLSELNGDDVMTYDSFYASLEQQISHKHLLTHPFYLAWSKGELSKECLLEYALQYYHHVKAFPRYLAALLSHIEDSFTRKHMLQNLIDEEAGSPNYPEMWRAFILSLGGTEEQIDLNVPEKAISALVDTFKEICLNG